MRSDSPFIQSGLTLLSELNDADLEWFLSAGKREKVPANAVVVGEGTQVHSIYVVLQGLQASASPWSPSPPLHDGHARSARGIQKIV